MQKLPSVAEQENQIYDCNFSTDYPCTHLVVDPYDRVHNLPHILEHETLHKANGGRRSRGIPSLVLRRYEQIHSSTAPQTHKPTDPALVLVAFRTLELRYKLHYARFHHTGKSTLPN